MSIFDEKDWSMPLSEHTKWSIRLGFKGVLNDDFYNKMASVKKVRKRIRDDLWYSISAGTGFSIMYLILHYTNNDYKDFMALPIMLIQLVCVLSIVLHMRVMYQWNRSDEKHINDYESELIAKK
jgi:hypothetical protein